MRLRSLRLVLGLVVSALLTLAADHHSVAAVKPEVLPLMESRWCPTYPMMDYETVILKPTDKSAPLSKPAPITDMPVVNIDLAAPEGDCKSDCRKHISQTLAQTLNLWRQICARCKPGTMAYLVDNEAVYIDTRLYAVMASAEGSLFEQIIAASAALFDLANAGDTGTGHVLGTYAIVPRDDPKLLQYCAAPAGSLDGTWAAKLASALCGDALTRERVPSFRISFEKQAVCGNPDFVACAEPDRSVSISLDGLSYWSEARDHAADAMVIGDPTGERYSLTAVLLHEGGHFLGLPHVPHEDLRTNLSSAMLSAVDSRTCLSMTERMMLNSAADLGWLYRASGCAGLLRREVVAK